MKQPLDEAYLHWLYRQVGPEVSDPRQQYWELFRLLYKKEFVWIVPNDDNRAEDGIELRKDFCVEEGIPEDEAWMHMPCSVLEMLVGVAKRMCFILDEPTKNCFWTLMYNLELDQCTDGKVDKVRVDTDLDDLIWRRYLFNGKGGLFPIEHPEEDQRKVEIWYQMNAYLLEQGAF
jgi:hypothetical protein